MSNVPSVEIPAIMTPSSVIAAKLREDIHTGQYVIGQKLDGEHLLAKRLKVNRVTIRKALKIFSV